MKEIDAYFNGIVMDRGEMTIFCTLKENIYFRAGELYEIRLKLPLKENEKEPIMLNFKKVTKGKIVKILNTFSKE